MISGVTVAVTIGIDGGYMLYNWICLPCFAIILLGLSGVKFNYKESKVLKVLCGASYMIFLAQLFSNRLSSFIIEKYRVESNGLILLTAWGLGLIFTAILRIVEKRLTVVLMTYAMKRLK